MKIIYKMQSFKNFVKYSWTMHIIAHWYIEYDISFSDLEVQITVSFM